MKAVEFVLGAKRIWVMLQELLEIHTVFVPLAKKR